MQQLNTSDLIQLLAIEASPCISLYQPTHRHHPGNEQDPIRFRNLVKQAEASLAQNYSARDARALLEPFHALARESDFWEHTLDGLVVVGAPGVFRKFSLQRPVTELVVVAVSFHLKPLLRVLQSADRYQVLCVNRREIKLYEGNRYGLDEVELARDVPRTIEEALGAELTEPHLHVSSYGAGSGAPLAPHGEPRSYHGHGGKKDELDIDTQRFFRAVDRAILEHHSRPSGLPLMLAALGEYHAVFHEVSHNPFLLAEGIELDPDALSADRLREEAWRKFAPRYRERLAKLIDEFHAAEARQNASSDLAEVAGATAAGRVRTLLIEADRQIPGKLEPESGKVSFNDLAHPRIDDLLDELAELALRMGGEVIVAPREAMPSTTGLAAIYSWAAARCC